MTFLLPLTLCLRKLPNVSWSICRGLCEQFGMEFAENWYEQLKYRSKVQVVKDLKLTKLHTTQTLNFLTRHVHVQVQNTYCSNHCIVCLCKTNSDTITYSVTVLNPLCIAGRRLQSFSKGEGSPFKHKKNHEEKQTVL